MAIIPNSDFGALVDQQQQEILTRVYSGYVDHLPGLFSAPGEPPPPRPWPARVWRRIRWWAGPRLARPLVRLAVRLDPYCEVDPDW